MSVWKKLDERLARFEELERLMADPEIAANANSYNTVAREHGSLSRLALRYRRYKKIQQEVAAAQLLLDDDDMAAMAQEEINDLMPQQQELETELTDLLLVSPDEDFHKIIVEVRAGTGGEEAALFARDLFDMYQRYSDLRGWKTEVIDFHTSDQRGFKEVSFSIEGEDCYRELCFESGGHRVQRVPETETQGRIHTSAATVAVLPEPEAVDFQIPADEIEMEAVRSSGPGGQHVNKTSSAVRLTHRPSGVVVFCQDERSQHKNRAKAMRLLLTRIFDMRMRAQQQARAASRKLQIGSGDRSERIRTYNFPQNRCTDHRLNMNFNLQEIMVGNLNSLMKALRDYSRQERLAELAAEMN